MVIELPSLYPHQVDMMDRLRQSIARHRASILQAPPGTGKTRVAKAILGSSANREPKPTQSGKSLFAVHRRGLVDNASNSFSETPTLPHGVLMSGVKHDTSQRVQVASIDTLLSWFCEGGAYNWDETFDLVIFDEAHSHGTKLQTFLRSHNQRRLELGLSLPYVIGLTATPQAQGLSDLYHEIVRGPETQWLIDQGFLKPYRYFRATQGKLGLLVKRGDEYTKDSVCSAMEGLSGDLVRDWRKFAEGRATVGFFPRRTHAQEAMEALCAAGIKAEYVDGETDDERRQLLYKWLNNGTIDYLCNVGVVERGTDIPRVGCVQMCTAVGNVVRFLQMVGRGSRIHPDVPDCIAEGELVLTDKGLVPIEQVSLDMLLWDGMEFVSHDGVVCKGERDVIECCGVYVTPDHKMWTQRGWERAVDCVNKGIPVKVGENGGKPVREIDCYFRRSALATEAQLAGTVRNDAMHYLWHRGDETALSRRARAGWMSVVSEDTEVATEPMRGCSAAMLQSKQASVPELRRERGGVSVCESISNGEMDHAESWHQEALASGPHKQFWALRTWQHTTYQSAAKPLQQARRSRYSRTARLSHQASRGNVCGQYNFELLAERHDVCADSRSLPQTEKLQAKRRVWDILNAGSRNRFVVGGLIVSNCLVLDHGNNVQRHGFFEDQIPWTLDWTERPSKDHVARPKIECPVCQAVYRGGKCRNCGYEPSRGERKSQGLEFDGSELKEVKRKEKTKSAPKSCEEIMISALYACGRSGRTWKQALAIAYSKAKQQGTPFKVPKRFEVAGRVYKPVPYGSTDASRRVRDLYDFV